MIDSNLLFTRVEEVIGYKPKSISEDKVRMDLEDALDKAKETQLGSKTGDEFLTNKDKLEEVLEVYSLFMEKLTN